MRFPYMFGAAALAATLLVPPAARADVTYDFVPIALNLGTGLQPYGSTFAVSSTGCGDGNSPCYAGPAPGGYAGYSANLSMTFTDAVVARGGTTFCNSDRAGCPPPSFSGLVSETGLDNNGLFATDGLISLSFNGDGTLSGNVTNCPSSSTDCTYGQGGVTLSGTGNNWSGFAGNVTPDFQPFYVAGYWRDPSDPSSLPAPSSLALIVTALVLWLSLGGRRPRNVQNQPQ